MTEATADESLDLLKESAREFLSNMAAPASSELTHGDPPLIDSATWRELADLGWLGLGLPESMCGIGFGPTAIALLCEELGSAAALFPYVAASVLPAMVLAGSELNQSTLKLAQMLQSGERSFALAWQEAPQQFAVDQAATQLRAGRLSGTKCVVVAAEASSILLVSALHHDQLTLVAVAADAPGVKLERQAAALGSQVTVVFEDAPLLFEQPLASNQQAIAALARAVQFGRIALSAQLLGLASGALDKTLKYVSERVQFARPLSSFQSIRHRCVDLFIATQLAKASYTHALKSFEAEPDTEATAAAISAAKARCGDVAVLVAREGVQMHGAMGFTEEGGMGAYLRCALHGRAWLGTPLTHRRQFMSYHSQLSAVMHA